MATQKQIDAWQEKRKDGYYEDVAKKAAEAYYETIKNDPGASEYVQEGFLTTAGRALGQVEGSEFEVFWTQNRDVIYETLVNVAEPGATVSDEAFKNVDSEAELLGRIQSSAQVAMSRAVKISAELDEAAYTLIDPTKGYMPEDIASEKAFKKRQGELQKEQSDRDKAITKAAGTLDLVAFSEQCFLMSQLFNLVDLRKIDQSSITVQHTSDPNAEGRKAKYVDSSATDMNGNLINDPTIVTEGDKMPPNQDGTNNNTLLLEGSPYNFMNKLTQNADYSNFFDMTAADISSLQPSIRLYKIIQDEKGNEIEHEIQFDSHHMQVDPTSNKNKRGHGVGIKSFKFSFEGTDYYSVKKAIKANLVIFANDFNELLKERWAAYFDADGEPKEVKYQYIDMALKTSNTPTAQFGEKLNRKSDMVFNSSAKLNFRLKAVVGWAVPRDRTGVLSMTALRDSIYNSYITLQLTPTVHSFDFDDLGRCTFTIPYLAYTEDFFDHPNFNIFTDPLSVSLLEQRETTTNALNTYCDSDTRKKITEQEENTVEAETEYMKKRLFTQLMAKAIADDAIRYIPIAYASIKEFNKLGAGFDYSSYFESITTQIADTTMTKEIVADAQSKKDDNSITLDAGGAGVEYIKVYNENDNYNVNFFYLSDMVDVIMNGIEQSFDTKARTLNKLHEDAPEYAGVSSEDWKATIDKRYNQLILFYEQWKKLRIVLGPMEIVDPIDASNSKTISIGDLPISAKYFQEWMVKEVEQEERAIFSIAAFLNKFLNQFVADTLNVDTCFRGQIKQSTKVTQAAISAYKESARDLDAISDRIFAEGWQGRYDMDEFPDSEMPLLATCGDRDLPGGRPAVDAPEREVHYLIYYAGRTQPKEAQNGLRGEDHARGVFHYGIGQQKGIVKTINFQRQSTPGLKEVAYEQNGHKGISQLREQYNVAIKTFANIKAQPGSYIYVEPQSFAPGAKLELTQLGVGGYYMIMHSEHTFAPGRAETSITANWSHGLHSAPTLTTDGKVNEEVSEIPKGKCAIRA